jgi:S1-C subfamily serine protease
MDEEPRLSRRHALAGMAAGLSAAIAGCALGTPQSRDDSPAEPDSFPDEFDRPGSNPDQPETNGGLTSLYEDVVDSVAAVRIETAEGVGGGTAWVYDAPGNYLVTNEHVVRESDEPFVWFNESGWREGSVVGTDFHSDLAVVEVPDGMPEGATGLPLVAEPVPVVTDVVVIGNPFNLTGSFTTGVISGRNRNIDTVGREFSIADGVQTDAPVNPGNSGGPLLTHGSEVAGVISAGQGQNIGFAISARMASEVIPELIEDGEYRHSRMGVLITDVTPEIIEANELSVTWGVYVVGTQDGLPADGVLQGSPEGRETTVRGRSVPTGGDVIVELANDGVRWSIPTTERLSAFLALHTKPGDTIEVVIRRDGEEQSVDLTLASREGTTEP